MTSAPQSANCLTAVGPERTRVKSRTLIPESTVEAMKSLSIFSPELVEFLMLQFFYLSSSWPGFKNSFSFNG
jgi:hypothetical protein